MERLVQGDGGCGPGAGGTALTRLADRLLMPSAAAAAVSPALRHSQLLEDDVFLDSPQHMHTPGHDLLQHQPQHVDPFAAAHPLTPALAEQHDQQLLAEHWEQLSSPAHPLHALEEQWHLHSQQPPTHFQHQHHSLPPHAQQQYLPVQQQAELEHAQHLEMQFLRQHGEEQAQLEAAWAGGNQAQLEAVWRSSSGEHHHHLLAAAPQRYHPHDPRYALMAPHLVAPRLQRPVYFSRAHRLQQHLDPWASMHHQHSAYAYASPPPPLMHSPAFAPSLAVPSVTASSLPRQQPLPQQQRQQPQPESAQEQRESSTARERESSLAEEAIRDEEARWFAQFLTAEQQDKPQQPSASASSSFSSSSSSVSSSSSLRGSDPLAAQWTREFGDGAPQPAQTTERSASRPWERHTHRQHEATQQTRVRSALDEAWQSAATTAETVPASATRAAAAASSAASMDPQLRTQLDEAVAQNPRLAHSQFVQFARQLQSGELRVHGNDVVDAQGRPLSSSASASSSSGGGDPSAAANSRPAAAVP